MGFGYNLLGITNSVTMYSPTISANGNTVPVAEVRPRQIPHHGYSSQKHLLSSKAGLSAALLGKGCTFFSSLIFFKAKRALLLLLFLPKFGQRRTENLGKKSHNSQIFSGELLASFQIVFTPEATAVVLLWALLLTLRNLSSTWG